MKGCPLLAASEATLPPLGALERWRDGGREGGRRQEGTGGEEMAEGRAEGADKVKGSPRKKRRGENNHVSDT